MLGVQLGNMGAKSLSSVAFLVRQRLAAEIYLIS